MTAIDTSGRPDLGKARVTWLGIFRSEWTKFWSLRSTYIIIATAAVVMIGFSVLFALGIREGLRAAGGFLLAGGMDLGDGMSEVIAWLSLQGTLFAQLAVGVLGVLLVTGEYSSGMIRASFSAVPKRLPVLIAKAAVLVVVTLITMIPISALAFLAAQGLYAEFGIDAQLTDPGVARIILGVALYLSAIAGLGCALGWLFRNAAGAIVLLVVLVFLLPLLLPIVSLDWVQTISDYLPSAAGSAVYAPSDGLNILPTEVEMGETNFGPWEGYGILLAWAIGGLAIAAWNVMRRDA